jgi:hypothetical protein
LGETSENIKLGGRETLQNLSFKLPKSAAKLTGNKASKKATGKTVSRPIDIGRLTA